MKRQIIKIDEEKCTGCGLCLPGCPEGAIQLIDGKARLVSDLFCDGLGACLGHCPENAITIEEREAESYDEKKVMENILKQGDNTVQAHLKHLKDHNQADYYKEAIEYLENKGIFIQQEQKESHDHVHFAGCPGSQTLSFERENRSESYTHGSLTCQLSHWPIQLHLISPNAPHYIGSDMLLVADCVAFSLGDFHQNYLKGKTLAIACPKLDDGQNIYLEKLKILIDEAKINTLTVMIMQVPCCGGLLHMAKTASDMASRKIPLKVIVTSLQGNILREEWI